MPPKDPYIQVRVLDDIGEGIVLSDDKTANFALHSIHFLKRTDAEQYISRVGISINFGNSWYCLLKCLLNLGSFKTGINGGA